MLTEERQQATGGEYETAGLLTGDGVMGTVAEGGGQEHWVARSETM